MTRGDSSTTSSLWSIGNGTLMTIMRRMIHNQQLLDMGSEQGFSHLHPNCYILLGNSVNYRNGSKRPVLPAPGNFADLHIQFTDFFMTNCVHASDFNGMQYHRSVSSNYVGELALANFYNSHMPSSSNGLVNSRSSAIIFMS